MLLLLLQRVHLLQPGQSLSLGHKKLLSPDLSLPGPLGRLSSFALFPLSVLDRLAFPSVLSIDNVPLLTDCSQLGLDTLHLLTDDLGRSLQQRNQGGKVGRMLCCQFDVDSAATHVSFSSPEIGKASSNARNAVDQILRLLEL